MTHRPALLLVLGILALPILARAADPAQASGTITLTESLDPSESPKTINAAECTGTDPDGNSVTDNLTVAWAFTSNFTSGDSLRIDVSSTSLCPTPTASVFTGTLVLASTITNPTASDQWPRTGDTTNKIKVADLISTLATAGASISCSTGSTTIYVCALDVTTNYALSASFDLNTLVPAAPTGVIAEPGNNALYVSWTEGTGGATTATHYLIRATAQNASLDPTPHNLGDVTGTNRQRIGGLINGVTYDVVVYALSKFDNRSAVSNTATGIPIPTDDFWLRYRDAGGVEEGGCGGGPAGTLSLLLLLAALWLRRRP